MNNRTIRYLILYKLLNYEYNLLTYIFLTKIMCLFYVIILSGGRYFFNILEFITLSNNSP